MMCTHGAEEAGLMAVLLSVERLAVGSAEYPTTPSLQAV